MKDNEKLRLRKVIIKGSADKMTVLIFRSVIEKRKRWERLRLCKCKSAKIPCCKKKKKQIYLQQYQNT